jgi:hypothetical protein
VFPIASPPFRLEHPFATTCSLNDKREIAGSTRPAGDGSDEQEALKSLGARQINRVPGTGHRPRATRPTDSLGSEQTRTMSLIGIARVSDQTARQCSSSGSRLQSDSLYDERIHHRGHHVGYVVRFSIVFICIFNFVAVPRDELISGGGWVWVVPELSPCKLSLSCYRCHESPAAYITSNFGPCLTESYTGFPLTSAGVFTTFYNNLPLFQNDRYVAVIATLGTVSPCRVPAHQNSEF